MMRQLFSRDSVALTGSLVGLLALLPGWLTLKPNRLAAGTSLSLWDSLGETAAAAMVGLWLVCLGLSLLKWGRWRGMALGITANVILALTLALVGLASTRLLTEGPALARVSLGAGFWTAMAGAYTVIFAARQRLTGSRTWRNLVSWGGLVFFIVLLFSGGLNHLSIMQEFRGYQQRFLQELLNHVRLFAGSVAIATLIGIPLGIWATRNRYIEKPVFFITNIMQTVPSLALFGLLIAPLSALSFAFPVLREFGVRGVGVTPAIIALTIYSLLPVVRNTFVGIRQVDPAVIDAGRGMGMGRGQVFRRVEAPLATPLVLEGVRTASVQAVGLVTVAALIGAGGLGWFVFRGIGQAAPDLIILGALPIIALALVIDALMRAIVRLGTPRGLGGEGR